MVGSGHRCTRGIDDAYRRFDRSRSRAVVRLASDAVLEDCTAGGASLISPTREARLSALGAFREVTAGPSW